MAEEPHILLVDDEREIREPLAQYLSRNGGRVTKAENAAAARQLLSAYAIDLVLLDIMMPGEDGLALAGFIRATSEIPVILLTAKAEEMDRGVGLEVGAGDYVTKACSPPPPPPPAITSPESRPCCAGPARARRARRTPTLTVSARGC